MVTFSADNMLQRPLLAAKVHLERPHYSLRAWASILLASRVHWGYWNVQVCSRVIGPEMP